MQSPVSTIYLSSAVAIARSASKPMGSIALSDIRAPINKVH
jgi:hypothetical protein